MLLALYAAAFSLTGLPLAITGLLKAIRTPLPHTWHHCRKEHCAAGHLLPWHTPRMSSACGGSTQPLLETFRSQHSLTTPVHTISPHRTHNFLLPLPSWTTTGAPAVAVSQITRTSCLGTQFFLKQHFWGRLAPGASVLSVT